MAENLLFLGLSSWLYGKLLLLRVIHSVIQFQSHHAGAARTYHFPGVELLSLKIEEIRTGIPSYGSVWKKALFHPRRFSSQRYVAVNRWHSITHVSEKHRTLTDNHATLLRQCRMTTILIDPVSDISTTLMVVTMMIIMVSHHHPCHHQAPHVQEHPHRAHLQPCPSSSDSEF